MSATRTRSVEFQEAATVSQTSTHEYLGHVHPDYSYGPAAHGGFLICLAWQAVRNHFATTLAKYGQPDTMSFHVEFLRPATIGEIKITVNDLRLGKASSTVSFAVHQGGKERVVGFATNINRPISKGISMPTGYSILPSPPPINFHHLEANSDPNWVLYQVPYRPLSNNRALSNNKFAFPRTTPGDKGTNDAWIARANPSGRWHTNMFGLILDCLVPALENFFPDSPHSVAANAAHATRWNTQGHPPPEEHHTWSSPRFYLTANMTIEVKRSLPDEGVEWLFVRNRTKAVVDGKMDVVAEVWDVEERLVAVAQSLWMVVDTSRVAVSRALTHGKKGGSKM